jgi:hypothetical protein
LSRRRRLLLHGALNFGVSGDYDSAPDIDVLCTGIEHGVEELVDLSGQPLTTARKARARQPAKRTPAN